MITVGGIPLSLREITLPGEIKMMDAKKKKQLYLLLGLMGLAVALAAAGAFILTDAGQIFGVAKEVVIGYFHVHKLFMSAAAA